MFQYVSILMHKVKKADNTVNDIMFQYVSILMMYAINKAIKQTVLCSSMFLF